MSRKILLLAVFLFIGVSAFGQDPGVRDSLIVGTVTVDTGISYISVPIYVFSDDTITSYDFTLTWHPSHNVSISGIMIYEPISYWGTEDSIWQNYVSSQATADIEGEDILHPLFTNRSRLRIIRYGFTLFFLPPQTIVIDSAIAPYFGIWHNRTTVPAFRPGAIIITPQSGIDGANPDLPKEVFLSQNYPNPFNGSTVIKFAIAEREKASLRIYDLLGREVRTLIDEPLESGNHSIVWDGRDDIGMDVPSGIYFYRVLSASYEDSKRMVIVR
jgi:hypothetical protein